MDHDVEGAKYAINLKEYATWSWKVMVWLLNKTTREDFAKDGIVDFWFAPRDEIDALGIKTFGRKHFDTTPKVWDFYITRKDGTTHLFHPSRTNKRFNMKKLTPRPAAPPPEGHEKLRVRLKRLWGERGR